MSRFLSARFAGLKEYVPGEQPKDMNYIKLNTNESPYPPSPGVEAAISGQAISDLRLYSDPTCSVLKSALAQHLSLTESNIFIGNGSDEVLTFAFMAFCDENTGVSYPDISYGFYPVYADLFNLSKNEVPVNPDFTISPEDYFNAGTNIVLANPNAPTGLSLNPREIERIVSANPERVVVIDEAYVDFGAESCIPLTKMYDNLLVVQTFSKSRSLAGARLGFAAGSRELISDLEKLRYSTNPYNVNRLTMLAGIAAIEDQSYYDKKNASIIQIRDKCSLELRSLGCFVTESSANFLFASHPKISGIDLYSDLRSRGILVRHFAKQRIENFVRITVGTDEQMEALIKALKEMLSYAQSKN